MDYEKSYKEALERARLSRLQLLDIGEEATEIEYIFPELKSDDEKIRKSIIEVVKESSDILEKKNQERMIAWLEKQGEKSDYNPYKVTVESIAAMVEKYANGDLKDFYDNIKVKCKDAMEYEKTWLKKQCEQNSADSYCEEHCKGFQETGKCYADGECKAKREAEQNPAWSDEDELNLKQAIYVCHQNGYASVENWLKSLKPQPHWKPSEEQLNFIINLIDNAGLFFEERKSLEELLNDIKRL